MSDYLSGFMSLLSDSQKERLMKFIGKDVDKVESEDKIQEIIDRLDRDKSVFNLRPQKDQTDSESYNLMIREIYTDLYNLFNKSNNIDKIINSTHQVNTATLQNIQKDISSIKARIKSINLLADNTEDYDSAIRESFVDTSNSQPIDEKDILFIDRNGDNFHHSNIAEIGDETLYMSYTDSHNASENASIKIMDEGQVGEGFRADPRYNIDSAIDSDDSTFWGEVILSDKPLRMPFRVSLGDTAPAQYVDRGAVCQFKIDFPRPSNISEISFSPYSEFPIEILAIGYTTDKTDKVQGYIKKYNEDEPLLVNSRKILKFPEVVCHGLVFIVRQLHATKKTYLVTKDKLYNTEMWEKISSEVIIGSPFIEEKDRIQHLDIDTTEEMWEWYKDAVTDFTEERKSLSLWDSIVKFFVPSRRYETYQVDKYEYIYGAYDIKCVGKKYDQSSIFVSKSHNVPGNVQQVVLEADEWHPIFHTETGEVINKLDSEDDDIEERHPLKRTTIEYYMTHKENPGMGDWFPILPLGQYYIDNEILLPSNPEQPKAKLRWPVDKSEFYRLYRDEEPLKYEHWELDSQDSQTIYINPDVWLPSSIYTIDYTPSMNPNTINFSEVSTPIGKTDIFPQGANRNNTIELTHYPYIDKQKIRDEGYSYNPVRVSLHGHIQGDRGVITEQIRSTRDSEHNPSAVNARLLNVTNYRKNIIPGLKSYNPTDSLPTFEYYQSGRNVYLTETFAHDGPTGNYGISHGNATITVDYFYLVSGIRIKIILRRTNHSDTSITPQVFNYTTKFKCLV